jgi:tetratricopeptide (TPR) repeat protein
MGVVYQARDAKLGRLVALKFLPQPWSHDESAKQRFVREAQAASATHHPNICTIHGIETADEGQLFIVMAFYEGLTLKQRLERGQVATDEALEIATQMADGLAKAHTQGVVHRDIKPGNIMLTEDGVRILDFGLATFVDALKLTDENASFGTPAYMSPEQVRGHAADARSDVWAAGVVLYEMLAGHVPFQGSHAEAIAHAIRHEAAEPLHLHRPELPEQVEQLVFRALHKEPGVRYQSGRALARALRQVRGLSIPLDLRTEPVPSPPSRAPRRRARLSWRVAVAAVVTLLTGAVAYLAAFPPPPARIVVAPFGNHTGDSGLEGYRLALTHTLTLALRDSRGVSVAPYRRVLQVLNRFVRDGVDVASRDVIAAIAADTGIPLVIVPTLHRDGGDWRGRVELRDAETAASVWSYETTPRTTALSRDAAHRLTIDMARAVEQHLTPRRTSLLESLKGVVGIGGAGVVPHVESLDAARAFEVGIRQYEHLEYAAARDAFAAAVNEDPRNPLALAWLSRSLQMTRDGDRAIDAGDRALSFVTPGLPAADVLFARAVAREARREFADAEEDYRALIDAFPGDATWLMELGAFLDRRERSADAAMVYREAMTRDASLVRPRLELCRLYSPSRLNEPVDARTLGETALARYRALAGEEQSSGGAAQSLLCLTDVLRAGSSADRDQARRHAESARRMFEALGRSYNLARADYYVALLAGIQGRYAEAVALGKQALTTAMRAGNVSIQPLILINLGVASVALGQRQTAAAYYQQAFTLYQSWREELRAAQTQANRGAMLIEYGNPEEGLRDVQNARAVAERLQDKTFQAFCARVIATYYRNHGRHGEAESELNKGIAIASERNLLEPVTVMRAHMSLSQFETGKYDAARATLLQAIKDGTGRLTTESRIRLARTDLRLGDLAAADEALARAQADLDTSPNGALRSLFALVQGERALESEQLADARTHFERAASFWADDVPQPAAIEARAYLGLLAAHRGRVDEGRRLLRASLDAAARLEHHALEARCRVILAQVEFMRNRFDQAAAFLNAIPPDANGRTIGAELRAEVHYWWSRIHAARGDTSRAGDEADSARAAADAIAQTLPDADRNRFLRRSAIRRYQS